MNITKAKIVALVVAVLVVIGGTSAYLVHRDDSQSTNQSPVTQTETKPEAKLTVSEDKKTVSYKGQAGKTALEVLQSLAEVTTQESSFGDFVTGINGVTADGSKQFWAFYADGAMANEGAGTYQSKDGEKLEWRLEDVQ